MLILIVLALTAGLFAFAFKAVARLTVLEPLLAEGGREVNRRFTRLSALVAGALGLIVVAAHLLAALV